MSKLKPFGGRVVRRTFFVGGFFPGTFATHFQLFNCKACDQYRNWLYLYLSSTKYCGVYIILICAIFRSTDGTLSLHRKRRKMFASTGRCKTDDFTIFRRSKRPKNKQFEKLDAPSSRHCARPINAASHPQSNERPTQQHRRQQTTNERTTNDQRPTTNDQRPTTQRRRRRRRRRSYFRLVFQAFGRRRESRVLVLPVSLIVLLFGCSSSLRAGWSTSSFGTIAFVHACVTTSVVCFIGLPPFFLHPCSFPCFCRWTCQ